MSRKRKHKRRRKQREVCRGCLECENATYLGEGDSVCLEGTAITDAKIVIESFNMPGPDYLWCGGKHFEEKM